MKDILNSNLEVSAGAGSGLKGYGNLVFKTYENKGGGLVPQPPAWTSLHPHSISQFLQKVHRNCRETAGKLGRGAQRDLSLASGLCEQKLG